MKERPILFSAPMVRALLDGRKTQTRRVCKIQPTHDRQFVGDGMVIATKKATSSIHSPLVSMLCPYGERGDRLWVRETWGVVSNDWDENGGLIDWVPDRPATEIREMPFGQGYYSGHAIYAADGAYEWAGDDDGGGELRSAWHPSIHMPRAASRILLEIVSVRVERLKECSEVDAIAEGATHIRSQAWDREHFPAWRYLFDEAVAAGAKPPIGPSPAQAYAKLWESINGAGSWDANPWVWVVEFKRVTP
jgi:hypothetical protein